MDHVWVHNISPFLFEIWDGVGIRWYGLAYLTGFMLAFYFCDRLAAKKKVLIPREFTADFITYAAIGTLVGGRLGYALFYAPDLFYTFHKQFPFWALLEVHHGGMASHGGIIGIALAAYLFARKHKLVTTHLIDILCLGGTLGVFFGRIANFINGELYGRECSPNWYFPVKFPTEIYTWGLREPQKLKALWPAVEAVQSAAAVPVEKVSADVWNSWIDNVSSMSLQNIESYKEAIVVATQKHNAAVLAALGPVLTPRYPSQLIQSLLEGLLVFIVLVWIWRKPRKPGVITATFGICYAITRIIGEQFRLPDQQIGFQALGLTRGQWLSIAMLAVFVVILILVLRRRTERIGGWAD